MVTVIQRCGEPDFVTSRVIYRETNLGSPALRIGTLIPITIEEWTYNFGPTMFMESLIFENGNVVGLRTLGYGQ